jgi:hypothetical protein
MLNSDHGIEHVTDMVLATIDSLERQGKTEPPGQNVNLERARQTAV